MSENECSDDFEEVYAEKGSSDSARRAPLVFLLTTILVVSVAVLAMVAYCAFRKKGRGELRVVTEYAYSNETDVVLREFVEAVVSRVVA